MKIFSIEPICNFKCDFCGEWYSKASPTWVNYQNNSFHCSNCGKANSLTEEQLALLEGHLRVSTACSIKPFPLIEKDQEKGYIMVKDIVVAFLKHNGYEGLYNPGTCGCKIKDLMDCDECSSGCEPGYIWLTEQIPVEERDEDIDYCIGPNKPPPDIDLHDKEGKIVASGNK